MRTQVGTLGYTAPAVLGLLSRGEEHTNALDMWSLGCLVHEILISQMPFLELDQGLDGMTAESGFTTSSLATTSLTAPKPQIDIQALHNYCSDHTKFPSEALKSAQASEEVTDFVQRLLAASPKGRPTATEALRDRWLVGGRWRNDWYDRLEREFSALGFRLRV